MSLRKGFTLIELLVVIAIIGILSSVVLTSLGTARDRARDSSASASLSSARTQAEISFDDNGDFDDVCTDIATLTAAAAAETGNTANCDDSTTAYAAEIELSDGVFFCVDSDGFAGEIAATKGATEVTCN